MRFSEFLTTASPQIISEWEQFARTCVPAATGLSLIERRDHVAGMLKAVAADLATPQTKQAQADKSKGTEDEPLDGNSAANSHGTDRASVGSTPAQMVSEFRALRASVLRLWSESEGEASRANQLEIARFNESIDQLLAESIGTYAQDVQYSTDLFLGILGHDLRNPLGAIMMSAALIQKRENGEGPHAKTATRILASGTRMTVMIDDLVDFTRTRLGTGMTMVRQEIDLAATCKATVDESRAIRPGTVVTFKASGELTGQWDAGRVAQALSNLIGNAFQHGTPGSPVEVELEGKADDVAIFVRNTGPVIAKSLLGNIFNPFRQGEAESASPKDLRSAGLGLFIAKAIAVAHGGTIRAESTADQTTFTIHLPRAAP